MASLVWGKVYYQNNFSGILKEELGGGTSFTYDPNYVAAEHPAISYTLPIQEEPHTYENDLLPYFDNLVSEGWLEHAQQNLLGKRNPSRFELLLAFGYDCAGAVSVIDPEPANLSESLLEISDSKERAVFLGRASLSGVQPKLAVVLRAGKYMPAKIGQISTYIAKFPSFTHTDLIFNEYLTMKAFKALLPEDDVVDMFFDEVEGISEQALIIKRFDRMGTKRTHFEEFNQLLNHRSAAKYDGSYKDMSTFILNTPGCLPIENYRLYTRILAGIILGNTDMHLKNFAMFHTESGLRLTPSYDQVAALLYQYKTIALEMNSEKDRLISGLKPKNIIALADEFLLSKTVVEMVWKNLKNNIESAKESVFSAKVGSLQLKEQIIKQMDARWNGTFALIGQNL